MSGRGMATKRRKEAQRVGRELTRMHSNSLALGIKGNAPTQPSRLNGCSGATEPLGQTFIRHRAQQVFFGFPT